MSSDSTNRPSVGVAVFIWKNGKFLIGKRLGTHGKQTWSIPGGHLELGESWSDCAQRETREECGLEITNIRFLAVTNDIFGSGKHYISIWMEADWLSGEVQILEPDTWAENRWIDIADLPDPLFEPCWRNLRAAKPELFAQNSVY